MVKSEQEVARGERGRVEVERKIKLEYCSTLAECVWHGEVDGG